MVGFVVVAVVISFMMFMFVDYGFVISVILYYTDLLLVTSDCIV